MMNLLQQLFPLKIYTDPIQRYRALGTYITATVLVFVGLVGLALYPLQVAVSTLDKDSFSLFTILGTTLLPLAALVAIFLTRTNRQILGALIIGGVWFIMAWYTLLGIHDLNSAIIMIMPGIALKPSESTA